MGTKVEITGPFGFFVLRDSLNEQLKHYTFVATGTGISPFHSIILSNPELDYDIIHGVKYLKEGYESGSFKNDCYHLCTSREHGENYHGRVTGYLKKHGIRKDSVYYICGNSAMVNEVTELLEESGILPSDIRTEVFF